MTRRYATLHYGMDIMVRLWYVYGMVMICLWYGYCMVMVWLNYCEYGMDTV